MQLERTETGFQIDAADLAPLLGVSASDVQRLMREGRVASLCEEGQGADHGRHRITFRHGSTRVRLTVNDAGDVLLRTRTTVAPRLGTRRQEEVGQSGETSRADPSEAAVGNGPAASTRRIEELSHAHHRRRLVELRNLAEMVEDLHDGDEGVPAGIHLILCRIDAVLDTHLRMTEHVVFPATRGETAIGPVPRIDVLRGNHHRLKRDCARIREITRNFALPTAACTSWATLYARLADFITDLTAHLRLESDALFPLFEPGDATPE
jgi:regulator of cell morphogenesis and NO signaling